MVNEEQKTREAIQELISYVCGLPFFDRKREIVDTLYTLEWSLRSAADKKVHIDLAKDETDEAIHDGHEEPWSE